MNERFDREQEVRGVMRRLAYLLQCNDFCEKRCVFPEVGKGDGCPLNDLEDKLHEAIAWTRSKA